MPSLFDELNDKVARQPRLTKHNLARVDLSMLLFNARGDLRALWQAAEAAQARTPDAALGAALDKLRPIFGPR